MVIPTLIWWKESVLWVALMSLYANFEASAAAYEAKKNQKDKINERLSKGISRFNWRRVLKP